MKTLIKKLIILIPILPYLMLKEIMKDYIKRHKEE